MIGLLGIAARLSPQQHLVQADLIFDNQWPGIWFICEFAQRQRAPDDACQMFDDEGFQLADGRLGYLQSRNLMKPPAEGIKKGNVFDVTAQKSLSQKIAAD